MPADVLRADCSRCFGLCCIALPFAASADFAEDKPAGVTCRHLAEDDRCRIHDRLREEGYRGCTVYDCFGAGQHVSQVTFAGVSWRDEPATAVGMFALLPVVRALNELRWLLTEALALEAHGADSPYPAESPAGHPLRPDELSGRPVPAGRSSARGGLAGRLTAALETLERLTEQPASRLLELDVDAHRAEVNVLLREASARARTGTPAPGGRRSLPRDLVGADLRGRDLRGADLRGAVLVAADLAGADLRRADLTGADLRDADLSGADLRGALFLTQAQLDAACGDAATRLPGSRSRPATWPGG